MEKEVSDSSIPTERADQRVNITIRDQQQNALPRSTVNPPPPPDQMDTNFGSLFCKVAIWVMFLLVLVAFKFQNAKQSPFKTDGFFLKISLATLPIAGLTCVILINRYLRRYIGEIIYAILKCVFYFSVIVSPLSLWGVLFIPRKLTHWIGYSGIGVIFVVVVAYNVTSYLRLISEKVESDLESKQEIKEDEIKNHPQIAT